MHIYTCILSATIKWTGTIYMIKSLIMERVGSNAILESSLQRYATWYSHRNYKYGGRLYTEPLSFTLDNITFCGTSLSDFHLKDETQYVEACKKFSLLKWGGHNSKFTSPYGSDDYGLMLCFCRHKNDCLKVNSKDDFFSFLEGKDYDGRQETYLCEHYCLRDKASGYRGFVDGIIN